MFGFYVMPILHFKSCTADLPEKSTIIDFKQNLFEQKKLTNILKDQFQLIEDYSISFGFDVIQISPFE